MARTGLKAARPRSLVDHAYAELLEGITSGRIPEGARIVIDKVAEELAVSRIPVREALARLHAQKLLAYERNKGYTVLPKADFDVLFQARQVIEPNALRVTTEDVSAADIKELRSLNDKIAALSQRKSAAKVYMDFFELNDLFHKKIVSLCHNPLISEAYDNLSYGPQWARHAADTGVPDLSDNVAEHEAIIDALEQNDFNAAAKLAEDHIVSGKDRFYEQKGS